MPEGWRGKDALSGGELAAEFWKAVSEPAPAADVKVGDIVTVDFVKGGKVSHHHTVRITECMQSPAGDPQVRFEYADQTPTSDVVLVVSVDQDQS